MPRTRRQEVPAATVPQRRASTDGRAVLLAPDSLLPRKITVKGAPSARRHWAAKAGHTTLHWEDNTYAQAATSDSGELLYTIVHTAVRHDSDPVP
jgi:hypothetical protein